MARYQPGAALRVGPVDAVDDEGDINNWVAQRNAAMAIKRAADAAGRQAWEDSVRDGEVIQAANPSDVIAIGMRRLRGSSPNGAEAVSGRPLNTATATDDSAPQAPTKTSAANADASPWDAAKDAFGKFQNGPSIPPPSTLESFIPVVGPAWQAASDLQHRDYLGAAFNGGLAVSDLFLGGEILKGVAKGGGVFHGMASRTPPFGWPAARKWMKESGFLHPGEEGHHWLIPQNQWGRNIPDWLKNQPWNIMSLDKVTHGRLRHRMGESPRFNPAQRYLYGTPAWSKAATVSVVGHPAAASQAQSGADK